ncbi:MAG: hypothetical protein ACQEWL_05295 [Pseudomonadota bacterium]
MPLPERLKPIKINRSIMKDKLDLLEKITIKIDSGAKEDNTELNLMMKNWNTQTAKIYEFSDFRDYNSWTSAKEFTKMAFNQTKYIDDLTYEELIAIIEFICNAEGNESEQSYTLDLLEINFDANPLDLIYWPNEWFNDEDVDDLSFEEIAAYLMHRSQRILPDSPKIILRYPIPEKIDG